MEKNQIYKCSICGNIVELTHVGGGILTCCEHPMIEMPELTNDAGQEKHVPVITETNDGIMVHVGSIDHPMEDIHYIEWIEIIVDGKIYREYLAPHQAPEVFFPIKGTNIKARAYCNLHGLRIS